MKPQALLLLFLTAACTPQATSQATDAGAFNPKKFYPSPYWQQATQGQHWQALRDGGHP